MGLFTFGRKRVAPEDNVEKAEVRNEESVIDEPKASEPVIIPEEFLQNEASITSTDAVDITTESIQTETVTQVDDPVAPEAAAENAEETTVEDSAECRSSISSFLGDDEDNIDFVSVPKIAVTKPLPDIDCSEPDTDTVPDMEMIEAEYEKVGTIYGNVGTITFDCHVCETLERSEYVMVKHDDYGYVLCQIGNLVRKSNLSLEKSLNRSGDTVITDVITAHVNVIGYRENGQIMTPRTTFKAGSDVLRADPEFVRKVLGLNMNPKTCGYIGILHGHDIPIYLDINKLVQKHVCILAKTGGGKSYMSGDIIEELMKHNVTCMIIDPHGEYSAMRDKGAVGDPKFNVEPKGYADKIIEFAVTDDDSNPAIKPLKFTFRTLEPRDIVELMRNNDMRINLPPMKKALEILRQHQDLYSVQDLIDVVNADPEAKNPVIANELEYINDMKIFATRGNPINELVVKGKTTVINLKGVPPDIQQMIVKRIATVMFELRKKGSIPPMMMVIEEAHNYCPQSNPVISSKPLATIASEGRKFGLGLMVISQRPAKIDKNVLSQCGTQIILKVTNPNDVKAISMSVEGLTSGMTDEITTMPVGMAMVVGAGIESPLLVEVRPRESKHGGDGVNVLEEEEEEEE